MTYLANSTLIMPQDTDRIYVAHLLKRTSFAVSSPKIGPLLKLTKAQLLKQLVDKAKLPAITAPLNLKNREDKSYPDFQALLKTELNRLTSTQSGLGDRMLWFWHGLITTSYEKVNYPALLWRQHKLIAKHALGSYRQLLIDISADPAMLLYLDGDGSVASDPNENYARELMELFAMGRGNYSQDDVKAAAKVLSGWYVVGLPTRIGQVYASDKVRSKFSAEDSVLEPLTFLGKTAQFDRISLIDHILQQDATALYIVKRLFTYFVHDQPSPAVLQELAMVFRQSGYQTRPVLSALFRHSEFTSPAALAGRPRLPMEWLLASVSTGAFSLKQLDYEGFLDAAGQMPFIPANVAGWPVDQRWLSAATAMARNAIAIKTLEASNSRRIIKSIARSTQPIEETLNRLALSQVSEQTRNQLIAASQQVTDRYDQARLLLTLALASPEFALT